MVWAPRKWTRSQLGSTTWKLLSGSHKVSSADLWGRPTPYGPSRGVLSLGGCPVGPCVGAWCPHEFEAVCLPVDPSILVVSMCRPLSRRGCFPWISDMACMHVILGGNPSLVRWRGLIHRRWVFTSFMLILPTITKSPRTSGTLLFLTKCV
jgi:hypothetical protein